MKVELNLKTAGAGFVCLWTLFGLAEIWGVTNVPFEWCATFFVLSVASIAILWLKERN